MSSAREWEVASADGRVTRYTDDDFDEIWETTDEHEMRRHVGLGWVLLDESVGAGEGPAHEEIEIRGDTRGGTGLSMRAAAVEVGPDDVTTYMLGHLIA